jgi:hypothetical protein
METRLLLKSISFPINLGYFSKRSRENGRNLEHHYTLSLRLRVLTLKSIEFGALDWK